jgi:hypothetical protein
VAKLLDDLGLNSLKSITLFSGFEGDAERGLVEMELSGPRKGLLGLVKGKPFKLGDVPPLPPDVTAWTMTNLDTGDLYDVGLAAVEGVVRIVAPDELPKVKGFVKEANQALGIDLRKDLLGSLGNQFVQYNSPSEGPLTLGQTFLFKVKDADKLEEALEQAIKGLAKAAGADVSIKKRTYRDVLVREVRVKQQGFFFQPTYAIHKGWLVVSFFPQPVHGYILRATGELPAWKPSARTKKSLEQLPQEFLSIAYSDPRPALKQILSVGPFIGGLVNTFNPESTFEVGSIPNAQEATRHLFPNVSVTTADDKTLRLETRASLALPFDLTGLDNYALVFFAFAARIF